MDLYLGSKRNPTKMAPKNGKKAAKSVQSNGVPALVSREMEWVTEFKQKCKTKDEQKKWAHATLEVQDETGKSKKKESAKKPECEITPDEMLERGLVMCQVDVEKQAKSSRKSNVESFRAEFGPDPKVLVKIWHDLQTTNVEAARIDVTKRGVTVENYLIAFNFLKRYPKSKVQGNRFNCAKNTILKWRWYFVDRIKALVNEKIVWPKEWSDGSDVPTLLFTVDGVHFQRNEPTHGRWSKNPKCYSHKFKRSAVNYEIAIHLHDSKVVHFRGPSKASTPDITIFREELINKIPAGHFCIGDKGYLGEIDKIMTPNSHDTPEVRKFKGRARARHETFNKMLKRFECLDERHIHKEPQQAVIFEAVLVICQYQMENGEPLFDV